MLQGGDSSTLMQQYTGLPALACLGKDDHGWALAAIRVTACPHVVHCKAAGRHQRSGWHDQIGPVVGGVRLVARMGWHTQMAKA